MTIAKIVIFCVVALQSATTFRRSSQVSFLLQDLSPWEDLSPSLENGAAWLEWIDDDVDVNNIDANDETMTPPPTDNDIVTKDDAPGSGIPTSASSHPNNRTQPAKRQHRKPNRYMGNLTHFVSHVPKSGTEYAAGELLRLLKSTVRLPNNRTEKDIFEAQKRFNTTLYKDGDFFVSNKDLDQATFPIDLTGETDAYTPPLICNHGTTPLQSLPPYYLKPFRRGRKIRYHCSMSATEIPWTNDIENVYTILREPVSHTLSQYFHCTESRDHNRAKPGKNRTLSVTRGSFMPSLDVWLKTYANLKDKKLNKERMMIQTRALSRRFKCYNPIDSESEFTLFGNPPDDNYTYPYPDTTNENDDRDEKTRQIDKLLFDDLKQKYKVIGDMSQMVKTVCAIFIDFTQGKHIPDVCDCTNLKIDGKDKDTNGNDTNSSSTFCVRNLYSHPHPEMEDKKACPIKIGYDATNKRHTHGVKHHGSSFAKELTDHQRELITKIRKRDLVLYNISRAVFAEQIREMETTYGIKICNDWNRPKEQALVADVA